jgi:hypothetical protein
MTDHSIPAKWVDLNRTEPEHCTKGVRVFTHSPYTAILQLRTHSKKMGYYMGATLNPSQLRLIAQALIDCAIELERKRRPDSEHEWAGCWDLK